MTCASPEPPTQHRAALTQAPVKALDPDGLSVICGGTVCFAAAAAVCWAFRDALAASGHLWWLWVAVTGAAMGVVGLALTLALGRRRRSTPPS